MTSFCFPLVCTIFVENKYYNDDDTTLVFSFDGGGGWFDGWRG